eukprot:m.213487 g.213487  ORF g.213487 m.213487 type:complete len:98 (+) comp17176_c0_seq18:2756-3049(+)
MCCVHWLLPDPVRTSSGTSKPERHARNDSLDDSACTYNRFVVGKRDSCPITCSAHSSWGSKLEDSEGAGYACRWHDIGTRWRYSCLDQRGSVSVGNC